MTFLSPSGTQRLVTRCWVEGFGIREAEPDSFVGYGDVSSSKILSIMLRNMIPGLAPNLQIGCRLISSTDQRQGSPKAIRALPQNILCSAPATYMVVVRNITHRWSGDYHSLIAN